MNYHKQGRNPCPGRGGGGVLGIYIGGVCSGTLKKGGLRCGAGTTQKGGLRCGYNQKKGGLRCDSNPKKGGI